MNVVSNGFSIVTTKSSVSVKSRMFWSGVGELFRIVTVHRSRLFRLRVKENSWELDESEFDNVSGTELEKISLLKSKFKLSYPLLKWWFATTSEMLPMSQLKVYAQSKLKADCSSELRAVRSSFMANTV